MNARIAVPARPHPFPLDPAHTALLVIDMQADFLDPNGGCPRLLGVAEETLNSVRSIIPRIGRVLEWARSWEMPIIYTREAHAADLSDLTESKKLRYQNAGYAVGTAGPLGRLLIRAEPGCTVIPELAPHPGDRQYDKPAQSAFVGTDLDRDLRSQGLTHLLFTGVTTQCCVLATYRQAQDLGYFGLLLEDCCASFDQSDHDAAIQVVTSEGGAVGWVAASEALLTAPRLKETKT